MRTCCRCCWAQHACPSDWHASSACPPNPHAPPPADNAIHYCCPWWNSPCAVIHIIDAVLIPAAEDLPVAAEAPAVAEKPSLIEVATSANLTVLIDAVVVS